MVAIGSCIGSGIFLTPAFIAESLPNTWLVLFVWIISGIITLTGALTFAEQGSMFPQAGGTYVYLREGYGALMAFHYGCSYLTVAITGAIAALSIAFATYLGFFIDLNPAETILIDDPKLLIKDLEQAINLASN